MSLKEKILQDMKSALKNRDPLRLKSLRFLQAAIKNKEIELRPDPIQEKHVLEVIKKQIKQTKESIQHLKEDASYKDRLEEEQNHLSLLEKYLPKPLSSQELQKILEEVIAETKPQSQKDMGQVMKMFIAKTEGKAEGKLLSQMTRERLKNL